MRHYVLVRYAGDLRDDRPQLPPDSRLAYQTSHLHLPTGLRRNWIVVRFRRAKDAREFKEKHEGRHYSTLGEAADVAESESWGF